MAEDRRYSVHMTRQELTDYLDMAKAVRDLTEQFEETVAEADETYNELVEDLKTRHKRSLANQRYRHKKSLEQQRSRHKNEVVNLQQQIDKARKWASDVDKKLRNTEGVLDLYKSRYLKLCTWLHQEEKENPYKPWPWMLSAQHSKLGPGEDE